MKRTVKIGLLFLVTFQFLTSCNENSYNHYESFEKVVLSGDLEKGWIPVYLPVNASDIRELHNIDTNQGYITFKVHDMDWDSDIPNKELILDREIVIKYIETIKRPRKPIWFISNGKIRSNSELFIFKSENQYFICDASDRQIYVAFK